MRAPSEGGRECGVQKSCAGQPAPLIRGDVFLPSLPLWPRLLSCCARLRLMPRAQAQADALRASVGARFTCVHWRASDFLHPSRLRTNKAAARVLNNSEQVAEAAGRAARTAGARSVLVLTNARHERARAFTSHLAETFPELRLTLRACSDAPPDVEKLVCGSAVSVLLSRASTFSAHIAAFAARSAQPTKVEYLQ